jgi:hypothetical protein
MPAFAGMTEADILNVRKRFERLERLVRFEQNRSRGYT